LGSKEKRSQRAPAGAVSFAGNRRSESPLGAGLNLESAGLGSTKLEHSEGAETKTTRKAYLPHQHGGYALSGRSSLYKAAVAAVVALVASLGVLFTVAGSGGVPQPQRGGNMVTAAAVERAGAILLPTRVE
jgi:hypothetical protein